MRKRLLGVLGCALLLACTASAQELARADRERLIQHLDSSRKALLDATKGLTEAQWNFKPGPDRWSVAEVAEHVALAEDFLFKLVTDQVMKAPAIERTPQAIQETDAWVLATIPDRTNRAQAPGPLVPSGRWSPAETLEHFQASRATTLQYAKSTSELRGHALAGPIGKTLDGYQYLLFLSAHCDRHVAQMKEVKADPGFPKP